MSNSSSDSSTPILSDQHDIEQHGYVRGFTVHDELSQTTASESSGSEHPDFAAIIFDSYSGDSSDTEEPIEVDYSAFAAQLNASAENPLTSTLDQQLNQSLYIHLEVSQLQVLEARDSRIIDRPQNVVEPNLRVDLVPADTPDQPNQIGDVTIDIFELSNGEEIKYRKMPKGNNRGGDCYIEEHQGIQYTLYLRKDSKPEKPVLNCNQLYNKKYKCKGKFLPARENGRPVAKRTGHSCPGTPMVQRNRAARRQVKADVASNAKRTCPDIAKRAQRDNYTAEDNYLDRNYHHSQRQLAQQAAYAKKKGHLTNPPRGNLWFDLRHHVPTPVYNDLVKVDIPHNGARHIVMANHEMIQRLKEAHSWYFDATFKICPNDHFKQLGSVHCIISNHVQKKSQSIPCAFILMSRRRASDYEKVFGALVNLVAPNPNLARVMLDFEAASWVALKKMIRNEDFALGLQITGCHFHFTQCIVRKIKKIGGGLMATYNRKGFVNHFCRKIMALALIPSSRINEAFDYLQSAVNRMAVGDHVLQGQLQELLQYLQSTWINGPVFKHKDWCQYKMLVRTNNHLEGTHSRYSKIQGSATPTFATLVDLLKDEAAAVPYTIAEVYNGRTSSNHTKAAAARNLELTDIWQRYETGLILDAEEMLDELTKGLVGPAQNIIDIYADPEDVDEDPEEQ